MGLDIQKLKKLQSDINSKSGAGDDKLFLYSNKLTEEDNVRLLPPPPEANGVYYEEQEVWWINGKMYVSNSTFGGRDIISEEIEAAKATKDKDLLALINAKKADVPVVKKETRYLLPILHLECLYNRNDELQSMTVIDDMAKVLVAKPSLLREINTIVTSRPYQNKTEDGIADRAKGFNMILSKKGKGLSTEYSAMGWTSPTEMDAKYYEKIPNVKALTEKVRKEDAYLQSVIRNYLYGEAIIEDIYKDASKEQDAAPAQKAVVAPAPVAKAVVKPAVVAAAKVAPAAETELPPAVVRRPVAPAARNLADDLLEGNDDLSNLDN